jgi:ankyrin repeat protein
MHDKACGIWIGLLQKYPDVQIVDLLLVDGRIDVNARNRHGLTAFHLTAKAGHVGVVNHLLMASTININAKNRKGRTALWNGK